MTADPDSEDAHTEPVGVVTERLEGYLDVLDDEKESIEAILNDLDGLEDAEALTREEYRQVFPRTMPLEEWGGFDGGR